MSDYSKIIKKIKKLLAKTKENGCSEEEAISAIAKAQELMARYKIEMDKILQDDEEYDNPIITKKPDTYCNVRLVYFYNLAEVIAKHFRCKMYISDEVKGKKGTWVYSRKSGDWYYRGTSRRTPVFYGRQSDVELACITFVYAYNSAWYGLRRYCREHLCKVLDAKSAYYTGYVKGLSEALDKQVKDKHYEIMIVPDNAVIESFNQLEFTKVRLSVGSYTSESYNHIDSAFNQGYEDGTEFNTSTKLVE